MVDGTAPSPCHPPIPLIPTIPYPTPMSTDRTRPPATPPSPLVTSAPSPKHLRPSTLVPMDTTHAPKSSRRKRPRGAPRGNQNARKHGLYSRLSPADRHAPLRRALRAYGFKPVRNADGIDLTDLVVNPDVNLPLLYSLIQALVKLAEVKAELRRM